MKTDSSTVFLTAEWRQLAMLNYEVDSNILTPLIPRGTELDRWDGKCLVSVVGFLFKKTRMLGFPVPFHRDFEEVNLRFYVRRKAPDGWRRGVVFIREFVPRVAIAWTARFVYNEPYLTLPMSHHLGESPVSANYFWRFRGKQNSLKLVARGVAQSVREGSEQGFITEHYWGYTAQRDGSTLEYQVEHPRWQVWEAEKAELDCDVAGLYGKQFCETLARQPVSAFLADGSSVTVRKGARLVSK